MQIYLRERGRKLRSNIWLHWTTTKTSTCVKMFFETISKVLRLFKTAQFGYRYRYQTSDRWSRSILLGRRTCGVNMRDSGTKRALPTLSFDFYRVEDISEHTFASLQQRSPTFVLRLRCRCCIDVEVEHLYFQTT